MVARVHLVIDTSEAEEVEVVEDAAIVAMARMSARHLRKALPTMNPQKAREERDRGITEEDTAATEDEEDGEGQEMPSTNILKARQEKDRHVHMATVDRMEEDMAVMADAEDGEDQEMLIMNTLMARQETSHHTDIMALMALMDLDSMDPTVIMADEEDGVEEAEWASVDSQALMAGDSISPPFFSH